MKVSRSVRVMIKVTNKRILRRTIVFTVIVFSVLSKVNSGGGDFKSIKMESDKLPVDAAQIWSVNASGRKFSYERRKGFRDVVSNRNVLVGELAVRTTAEELNENLALPFDIKVVFEECGRPDSFYDNESKKIVICNELIDTYHHLFSRTLTTKAARDEATKGAIVSMFLHEVAHALIEGWDLPITGREEDAADQFSTLMLINSLLGGEEMALNGARSFKLLAVLEKGQAKDYADPHSLDEQRFFNSTCLIYGNRPVENEYLIRNGTVPVERAFECEEDYARVSRSWQRLLSPYLIRPNAYHWPVQPSPTVDTSKLLFPR